MNEILLILLVVLATIIVLLQLLLWKRQSDFAPPPVDLSGVQTRLDLLNQSIQQGDRSMGDEFSRTRLETEKKLDQFRQGMEQRLESFSTGTNQRIEQLRDSLGESGTRLQLQVGQELERLTAAQKVQMDEMRQTVETRLTAMSADNEKRLEQMRQTVDEKLQGTLETRLGESFKQVSDHLERVNKGLGEMQTLASGVGDLKRVLTNVKTRGTWGEVQLGSLLEQILSPDQFEKNVNTTGTQERVEFAIKLPGREPGRPCWLPIDAKFPVEDYQRLVEASEHGDAIAVEAASRSLELTLKRCARAISEKYLKPPQTTDFGILFLSTEGLYAEALRRTGLAETLQREYRVILTGPNTFAAILNSLQMGFGTLAIQQRSSEVRETLLAVKTQFSKYADVLGKVKRKLQEASNTVEDAETRTRVLQRSLSEVESAPNGSPGDSAATLFSLELAELEEGGMAEPETGVAESLEAPAEQ